jgi:hypothetical protein
MPAALLSTIRGATLSEHELRRLRLALLLGLPLCGGLVLSLAFALTAAALARGLNRDTRTNRRARATSSIVSTISSA